MIDHQHHNLSTLRERVEALEARRAHIHRERLRLMNAVLVALVIIVAIFSVLALVVEPGLRREALRQQESSVQW